jgi:hypothetical protein
MLSKWKIWDFVKSTPDVFKDSKSKIIAFHCFDPIIFKMIKDSFNYTHFEGETLKVKVGKDVTSDWLEDEFKSYSLFGNNESFLIQHADELSQVCKDILHNGDDLLVENRFLILNFNKDEKLFKSLAKSEFCQAIQIQAPAFWENENLLTFFCDRLNVFLSFEAKSLLLEKVPSTAVDYFNVLSQIKINYPDKANISKEEAGDFIGSMKVDNFEMATLFGNKKLRQFYQKIVELDCSYDELRSIFYFLQSHLTKVYDSSYLNKKAKLTKYDKQIMAQAQIWKSTDLEKAINYLSDLELKAKTKDSFLHSKLKKDFLRTIVRF